MEYADGGDLLVKITEAHKQKKPIGEQEIWALFT
jgi:NIMA (never in mitosis gene a)-related kinase